MATINKTTKAPAKKKAEPIQCTYALPKGMSWRMQDYRSRDGKITKICAYCHTGLTDGIKTCACAFHGGCGNSVSVKEWDAVGEPHYGDCGHCPSCCSCSRCQKCGKKAIRLNDPQGRRDYIRTKGHHSGCGLCNKCCVCKDCTICGENLRSGNGCQADECKGKLHHSKCCDREEVLTHYKNKLYFFHRKPTFHTGVSNQLIRTKRHLGVEIEIAKFNREKSLLKLYRSCKKWGASLVHDDSIPEGFEINSSPAAGSEFIAQMDELHKRVGEIEGGVTNRCGMHVHVDARDFSYPDLINLIHLYSKIELGLFAIMPPLRRVVKYAEPCGNRLMGMVAGTEGRFKEFLTNPDNDNTAAKKMKSISAMSIIQSLYGRDSTLAFRKGPDPKRSVAQEVRYSALNIHSWFRMKTIEFRLHQGSTSIEDWIMWPQVVAAILDRAKEWPLKPTRFSAYGINMLPENPFEALLRVVEPGSKCRDGLGEYLERRLKEFSPDYKDLWPVLVRSGYMTPFKPGGTGAYKAYLGYSEDDKAWTWQNQKGIGSSPKTGYGSFASVKESIVPEGLRDKIAWIVEPKVQEQKPMARAAKIPVYQVGVEVAPGAVRAGGFKFDTFNIAKLYLGPQESYPPDILRDINRVYKDCCFHMGPFNMEFYNNLKFIMDHSGTPTRRNYPTEAYHNNALDRYAYCINWVMDQQDKMNQQPPPQPVAEVAEAAPTTAGPTFERKLPTHRIVQEMVTKYMAMYTTGTGANGYIHVKTGWADPPTPLTQPPEPVQLEFDEGIVRGFEEERINE